tara:strand:- start:603 stop:1478 length:876 start_codon:yes stop_codon:yes gene_type:complete
MDKIIGTGVALVTPFNSDHSIDFDSLKKLINYVIDGGVEYLVLLGTTAESATLSSSEKIQIVNYCKEINKNRIPIVLGIGGNNTSNVIKQIKMFDLDGIEAILSVCPYYNKPSQMGIYNHYAELAKSSPLPIILYNVPSRTSVNISSDTVLKLANDFKNIVAIKEASGDLEQIMRIIKDKPKDFLVISGDDPLTLPMIYMGGKGVISVLAQSHPKEFSKMVSNGLLGKIDLANKLHYKLFQLYNPLFIEGNPVGIKACLETLGIIKSFVRLPLSEASKELKDTFKNILNKN